MTKNNAGRRQFLKRGVTAALSAAAYPLVSSRTVWSVTKAGWQSSGSQSTASPAEPAQTALIKLDFDRQIGTIDRNIYGNFIEHLGRCIYGGIYDEGSPLSDSDGFRKDVLEAVRNLHVSVLRWPGGNFSSGYNWKDGIGPKDKRPRRWDTAWQAEESNRFGTDEFIAYCRKINAQPYICVNMGTGTMQEAADWVEYCNGTMNTDWVNLRRKNGHLDPYNVELWGLGNEIYGSWQAGHKDATQYAEAAAEFAKMMRWVDPDIKLVACGGNNADWDRQVLEGVGQYADYISMHHYGGSADAAKEMDDAHRLELQVEVLKGVLISTAIPGEQKAPIRIAADEWNIWYRSWSKRNDPHKLEEGYNLLDALWTASALNVYHRNCKMVRLANLAQLVNVIAPIITNATGMVLQATYYPLQLYAEHCQSVALDALVRSATFPKMPEVPYLDISATTDEKGEKLTLAVVNRHPTDEITANIVMEGIKVGTTGDVYEVNGANLEAANTFDHPNSVVVKKRTFSGIGNNFRQTYPAHSITMLTVSS